MMKFAPALVALPLLWGAPAGAKPPLTAPAPDGTIVAVEPGTAGVSQERAAKDEEPGRRVCRESVDLGSRLPRGKTCTTRGQLAQRKQTDRDAVEGSQNRQTMTRME